jgi:hypothetical protein
MAKTERTIWVLDTETKGTGAEMVPLEKLQRRRGSAPAAARMSVLRRPPRGAEPAPVQEAAEAEAPHQFRVQSVMTGEFLAEDVGAREAVEAMRSVRSVLDVRIDVWDPADEAWRPLNLAEKKAMWAFRGRVPAEP